MDEEPRENDDLLRKRIDVNNVNNQKEVAMDPNAPPDGGLRAYMVVAGAFIVNGIVFGIINTYSIIYLVLLKRLQARNVDGAEVKASLCGVLTIGFTFAISPVSGTLASFFGLRATAIAGGVIATVGLTLSSFVVDNIDALCFTYGILYGLGASLVYTPSLAILGHYFKKHLGLVNGIVTIGSPVFTVILPPVMDIMISKFGLEGLFRLLAVITVALALCGFLFKPVMLIVPVKADKGCKSLLKAIINVEMWKIKRFRLWALFIPIALFGYFVPYVHIRKNIEELQFTDVNQNLPLQCMSVTSAVGRLLCGLLADRPRINKILIQQITFYTIGILTIMLAFAKAFWLVVLIALGMGLCEGGFISLMGPVAIELAGREYAAQAIGCVLGIAAYPLCLGPPIAAKIRSHTDSYKLPFILAGTTPILGASLMFLLYFKKKDNSDSKNAVSLNKLP